MAKTRITTLLYIQENHAVSLFPSRQEFLNSDTWEKSINMILPKKISQALL